MVTIKVVLFCSLQLFFALMAMEEEIVNLSDRERENKTITVFCERDLGIFEEDKSNPNASLLQHIQIEDRQYTETESKLQKYMRILHDPKIVSLQLSISSVISAGLSKLSSSWALNSALENSFEISYLIYNSYKIYRSQQKNVLFKKIVSFEIGLDITRFLLMGGDTIAAWLYWQSGRNNFDETENSYYGINITLTSLVTCCSLTPLFYKKWYS